MLECVLLRLLFDQVECAQKSAWLFQLIGGGAPPVECESGEVARVVILTPETAGLVTGRWDCPYRMKLLMLPGPHHG